MQVKTPAAGGPHTIDVKGNNQLNVNDVLSGEVWLCTGQSNMDFTMKLISNDARSPRYQPIADAVVNEIATAKDPYLRHFEVPNTPSPFEPQQDFDGQWHFVRPETTGLMTATGYFFARELRKQMGDVPIGLVECAWGGTRVQPWISAKTYQADPKMAAY